MSALANFLSLLLPSRILLFGQSALEEKNSKKIKLILLLEEASENTKKKVVNFATYYKVPLYVIKEKTIASFLGGRSINVISVKDINASKKIINILKEGDTYE